MKNASKTIQIFLPSGDPSGIRVAEITTSILRVIDIPRIQLENFLTMPEASQVGIYFLLGENEEGEKLLYIGQSSELKTRLLQHHKSKEFWDRAIVALSLKNSFIHTHVLFLEWLSINEAAKADRFKLENGNVGSCPHAPLPLASDCHDFFDMLTILVGSLGYPIFKPLVENKPTTEEVFYCTRNGIRGAGVFTDEGFVVLAGSLGKAAVEGKRSDKRHKVRDELLKAKVVALENGNLIFKKNHLFKSPSGASATLLGRSSNGWMDWKDKDGRTLDEVKRVGQK